MTSMAIPADRSRAPGFLERPIRALMRRLLVRGNVSHGKNLRIGIGATVNSFHGLQIGNSVSIGQRSVVEADGTIGDFCLIGRHVQILGRVDHDFSEVGTPIALSTWVGERSQLPRDGVDIGRDVWIGANSVVLGGVRIGDGSVIGAGSVVTHDVPSYTICVGNPARPVGKRFETDEERMLHAKALDGLT